MPFHGDPHGTLPGGGTASKPRCRSAQVRRIARAGPRPGESVAGPDVNDFGVAVWNALWSPSTSRAECCPSRVWRGRSGWRTADTAHLDAKLQWLDRVAERVDVAGDEAAIAEWLEVYAVPSPKAGHPVLALYASEIAQREIFRELRRPAYLAGTGVLLGTLGSLLSLKS